MVLFVAQAISVGFYCVGFAESITGTIDVENPIISQVVAAVALVALSALAWIGADVATRFQYVVMALVVLALLSFAGGALGHSHWALLQVNFSSSNGWADFWIAFAIFFPAVTGFTQGVNMSGDLANPSRSIPLGTGWAVATSFAIYVSVAILCASSLQRSTMTLDYGSMKTVALWAPLIDAGIICATLSSALASLLGAPRILQSLAKDRVFPVLLPFAEGSGANNNPRRGVLLTAAIAAATITLGNLNLIAAVVSMFFVATYGFLNYATYFEARGRSPSFRPALRWYDPRLSLIGAVSAVLVMLAINLVAGLAAVAIVFGIFAFLRYRLGPARWSDGQRSYHLQVAREHLRAANSHPEHPRDWRPQILAFSSDISTRQRLLTFADWIEGNSGLTTAILILEGRGSRLRKAREQAQEELARDLKAKGVSAFPMVVAGSDLDAAVRIAVQSAGIGPTRVNTVLLNWVRQVDEAPDADRRRFARNLHVAFSLGCNLLVFDATPEEWDRALNSEPDKRRIDVWWDNGRTGRLMFVLAYLLTRDPVWRAATIRLLCFSAPEELEATEARLEKVIQDVRIPAEVKVVARAAEPARKIADLSAESSIVFLPLVFRKEWFVDGEGNDLSRLLPEIPIAVLTMAAEELDLSADPDEGEEAERAAAADAWEDAVRKKAALAVSAEKIAKQIAELSAENEDDATTERRRLEAALAEAETLLEEHVRDVEAARQIAEDLGVNVDEPNRSRMPMANPQERTER